MHISWAVIIILAVLLTIAATTAAIVWVLRQYREKARNAGYPSLSGYLRAAPRTDQEMRDAVDLTLKGLIICLLGLLFPPFLLVGVIALYYGARKVAYSSLGLGLVDDAEPST